jgi:hypothetical protein
MKNLLAPLAIAASTALHPAHADAVVPGNLARPNSFHLQSFQAGSTTEIDNLIVVDLDSRTTVYENSFDQEADATRDLRLLYWPEGGKDSSNYFLNNSTKTRVENGKLILETTGFNQNGEGGYNSHTEAEFTGTLPKNFYIEFEARRLQWAGHFHFHLYREEPTDSETGTNTPGGTFSAQRLPQKPADIFRIVASGNWFGEGGIIADSANTEDYIYSFPGPDASLEDTHKLAVALRNDVITFYLDGNVVNSVTVQEWALQRDSDGDGISNSFEYDDGSDPYDSSSFNTLRWNLFNFSLNHVSQSDADDYLQSSENVRKYSEWQSPPATYWGPVENGIEGHLVYKFPFDGSATRIRLKARVASWDFDNEPGGFGRGCSMLEASRDGKYWRVLKNSLEPRQWGVDWVYDDYLPKELTGTGELWVRVRMITEGAPNSSYTVAQFARSSSDATEPVFSVEALVDGMLDSDGDQDGDGVPNAAEQSQGTNPYEKDTDSDGVTDFRESRDGTDPADPGSFTQLSVDLLAHYTFDDTLNDQSGNGRHAMAPYTTFEPGLRGAGKSLGLSTGDSQANFWSDPNNTASPGRINSYTLSLWIKPTTFSQPDGTWSHLFSAPNNAAYLRFGNSPDVSGAKVLSMGHAWSNDPGSSYTTPAFTGFYDDRWHHVVGVQDGSDTRIYVNGKLVGSMEQGQAIPFDTWNYTIGNLFNTHTFQGSVDEARIYGHALSSSEVGSLYAAEVGEMDSDGDGLWDLHETGTGVYLSATDTGSNPYDSDTSDDGILDGEAVVAGINPNIDHSSVINLMKQLIASTAGRFDLYTSDAIMDLNLGTLTIQKSGITAEIGLQLQSTTNLSTQPFTNLGEPVSLQVEMPGDKGFIRVHALGPQ